MNAAGANPLPRLGERVAAGDDEALSARLRRAETIGRTEGDPAFLDRLERLAGRPLSPGKRGRKPKAD